MTGTGLFASRTAGRGLNFGKSKRVSREALAAWRGIGGGRAVSNLRFNPTKGCRPSLEFRRVDELGIDLAYQRSIETDRARKLIGAIARDWDWSLCQPLCVSRRLDGSLLVVDGQHRLAAARLRGDIGDLPCVVTAYDTVRDEAEAFVALNRNRRPLSALEIFRGSLASEDEEAKAVLGLIEAAGLSLAQHGNCITWAPGAISNIPGVLACYRAHGEEITAAALSAVAGGFAGQVLRYAGTIFPGIAGFLAAADDTRQTVDLELLIMVLQGQDQEQWVSEILLQQASGSTRKLAAIAAITKAYGEAFAEMDEAA